jgi:hypothetical protein
MGVLPSQGFVLLKEHTPGETMSIPEQGSQARDHGNRLILKASTIAGPAIGGVLLLSFVFPSQLLGGLIGAALGVVVGIARNHELEDSP